MLVHFFSALFYGVFSGLYRRRMGICVVVRKLENGRECKDMEKARPLSLRKWRKPSSMSKAEYLLFRGSQLTNSVIASFYRLLRKKLGQKSLSNGRFVSVETRSCMTDLLISDQLINDIQLAKWGNKTLGLPSFTWKDFPILKDPFALAVYPQLLWELKPATIIELGAYMGGSALWLADMMQAMKIEGHIFSYELYRDRIEVKHPQITFVKIDLNNLEEFDDIMLQNLPHPWLLIEDAHTNAYNTLKKLNKFLLSGDYLIVEDTLFPDLDKGEKFYKFLKEFGSQYELDTRYTDMYGYNVTWNSNGYLRKR
jgi:cephalosporin hydroxylase